MNALNAIVAALSPEKGTLLERRIRSKKSNTVLIESPREEALSLAFAQQMA